MKINRIAAAASAVAVSSLVLTSCAGGGGAAKPPSDGEIGGTLTGIFSASFKDTYEKIATAFEEKYPEVNVEFDYQGGDIGQLVMTQLQGGTAPDILTSFPGGDPKDNADTVAPLAAQGTSRRSTCHGRTRSRPAGSATSPTTVRRTPIPEPSSR